MWKRYSASSAAAFFASVGVAKYCCGRNTRSLSDPGALASGMMTEKRCGLSPGLRFDSL